MTYRRNPIDEDASISEASGPISENFTDYERAWNVNHVGINTAVNFGKHFKIDLTPATEVPAVNVDYKILNTLSATNPATNDPYQTGRWLTLITGSSTAIVEGLQRLRTTPPTSTTYPLPGWLRDPSGVLVKWGTLIVPGNNISSTYVFTFPVSREIPAFTQPPVVIINSLNVGSQSSSDPNGTPIAIDPTVTATGFTAYSNYSIGNIPIQYVAIGF